MIYIVLSLSVILTISLAALLIAMKCHDDNLSGGIKYVESTKIWSEL